VSLENAVGSGFYDAYDIIILVNHIFTYMKDQLKGKKKKKIHLRSRLILLYCNRPNNPIKRDNENVQRKKRGLKIQLTPSDNY